MNTTKITRIIASARFFSADSSRYSFVIILSVLSLCSATAAWSQGQKPEEANLPGKQVFDRSDGLQQPDPARLPPDVPNVLRQGQPPGISGIKTKARSSRSAQADASPAIPPFASYTFVNVTIPNSTYVQPNGVNDAGLVTGIYGDKSGKTHGFVWKAGSSQTLDYPGAAATYLTGTNNRGILIGYYNDASGTPHLVTYSVPLSTWSVLPDIPNYPFVQQAGINDDGVAVGYAYGYPFGAVAWMWHPDSQSYSSLSVPGAVEASTYPFGINEEGQVVGWFFSWPMGNGGTQLGFLKQACREEAYQDANQHCTYDQINVPGAFAVTLPTGINKDGTIAGWFFDPNFNEYGFVRTRSGEFRSVNAPGADGTTQINGTNDHGAICGYAYTATGEYGFVAYPE